MVLKACVYVRMRVPVCVYTVDVLIPNALEAPKATLCLLLLFLPRPHGGCMILQEN